MCGEVARRTTTRSATAAAAVQTVAVGTAAAVNCGVNHMYAGKLVEIMCLVLRDVRVCLKIFGIICCVITLLTLNFPASMCGLFDCVMFSFVT